MLVEKAFVEATSVVFELDLDAPVDPSPMFLPSGTNLSQILPATTYEQALGHWLNLGLPRDRIDLLKPAMVAMTLQMTAASKNGYSADLGVDRHFWDRATPDIKSRETLETIADQMTALTAAPTDEQISLLEYFMRQNDVGLGEMSSMVISWSRGDTGTPKILNMIRDPVQRLIVVGALHMVGPTGLPTSLRQRCQYDYAAVLTISASRSNNKAHGSPPGSVSSLSEPRVANSRCSRGPFSSRRLPA
jgi:uncharacterized protein YbaP (TraB family)